MNTTIFTFPFAGGSKYSYNLFRKFLPENILLEPLELPGRGERIGENLVPDLNAMAEDVYQAIKNKLPERYVFYAHSMGTILAYLVTQKILRDGLNPPLHLFLTGASGPSNPERERDRHLLPTPEFKEKLNEYGGSPDEVLQNDDLFTFFEPILRNDFKAVETYYYDEPEQKLNIPLTVLYGSSEKITREEVELWKLETTAEVNIRQFPGGHFFIYDYPAEVMKILLRIALN